MTTRRTGTSDPSGAIAFSPVDNDAPLRGWRWLRIVPGGELGAGRRAVLVALVAWLPVAVWAFATGRYVSADAGEPLLQHYGIHVRCLIAIPLFILAEAALHRTGGAIARRFVSSGTVPAELVPRFESVNRSMVRLRGASLPWVLAVGASTRRGPASAAIATLGRAFSAKLRGPHPRPCRHRSAAGRRTPRPRRPDRCR